MVLSIAVLWAVVACGPPDSDDAGPAATSATTQATTATTSATADDDASCSAAVDRELVERPQLPAPVADTRKRVAAAAAACDFDALAAIAEEGVEPFTYSFGDAGDPAGFWQREEQAGREPLRFLVELLDRPYGVDDDVSPASYAWPSAFAYNRWSDVPQADREALKPLYDQEDFAGFEEFGGYVGYRVVIDETGDWTAFVAGD